MIATSPDASNSTDTDDLWWGVKETARQLGVDQQTLRNWRRRNIGPRSVRIGGNHGHHKYRPAEVLQYIADCEAATEREVADREAEMRPPEPRRSRRKTA